MPHFSVLPQRPAGRRWNMPSASPIRTTAMAWRPPSRTASKSLSPATRRTPSDVLASYHVENQTPAGSM